MPLLSNGWMSEYEIRLIGSSGRLLAVYQMQAEGISATIEAASNFVKSNSEIAGAQVRREEELGSGPLH